MRKSKRRIKRLRKKATNTIRNLNDKCLWTWIGEGRILE